MHFHSTVSRDAGLLENRYEHHVTQSPAQSVGACSRKIRVQSHADVVDLNAKTSKRIRVGCFWTALDHFYICLSELMGIRPQQLASFCRGILEA
jgi:hypothetical protein